MKKLTIGLLVAGLVAYLSYFHSSPQEDIKVIVQKSFFSPASEPFLHMMATEVSKEREGLLVQELKNSINQPETVAKFYRLYSTFFSDREIHQIRKMMDMPVYNKYIAEGNQIIVASMDVIKQILYQLEKSDLPPPLQKREEPSSL